MAKMDYNCGLCERAGQADHDPEFVNNAETWRALLHCDRCADYLVRLGKLRDSCKNALIKAWHQRQAGKITSQMEGELRSLLEDRTKRIAHITCAHWRVTNVWDQDFVVNLLEHPDKCEKIITIYANGVKQISKQAPSFTTLN